MRVIVVSTEPPDPFGNAAGRWYYALAKGLYELGHRVRWLAAYTREASAAKARTCFRQSNVNLSLYPYPAREGWLSKVQTARRPYSYFISAKLAQDLSTSLQSDYDVVHFEPTWAGWLGSGVPRALLSVQWLAKVDLGRAVPGSFFPAFSHMLMKATERRLFGRFDTIRVLTTQDNRAVQELNPKARVVTIPLALDPALYPFELREPAKPTIGLIGSMGWAPTRSAAIRLSTTIWPKVKAAVKDAKLLAVGWDARRALAPLLDSPDVSVVENVLDAAPFFRELSLMVFPLSQGSGMKVKVLEAMAYGVPVVTTTEGVAGIAAVDGLHAVVADDDELLAQRTIALLRDREERRSMSKAARALIEEQYSPEAVMPQIEALYEQVRN